MKTLDIRSLIQRCSECGQQYSHDAKFCPFDGGRLEQVRWDGSGDPLVGTVVDGRYEIIEPIGEGGMGTVYRVRHTTLARTFAMKVLKSDLAQNEELSARFLREAKATAAVKHPQVVAINDFGRLADDRPYFVMEHLGGRTLSNALRVEGALAPVRVARIAERIARAVGAGHAANIIHRDIKPENVFLLDEVGDDVRVVDFGAAMIVGASRITKTGVVFGTPHYMSPEQAMGNVVDQRADIYALGIVMYEMLTGRLPFEADSFMGVITQHMYVLPEPPSTLTSGAELGALDAICMRALEKDPDKRYLTMAAFADDLRTAFQPGAAPPMMGSVSSAPRDRPRSLVLALGAVGVGVALLGTIAVLRAREPRAEAETPAALRGDQSARTARTTSDLDAAVALPPPLEPPTVTSSVTTSEPPASAGKTPRPVAPASSVKRKTGDDFKDPWAK